MPKYFAVSDIWINRLMNDDPNTNIVAANDLIVKNWNSVVGKEDIVYVLGGFGIADMYHILARLNGEIHFLSNYFNNDEKESFSILKDSIDKSSDVEFKKRIYFEDNQIAVLSNLDAVLSYFPLQDWPGKSTGTYCFHGLNDDINIEEHNITCSAIKWSYFPIDIEDIQKNITTFFNRVL